MEKEKIDIVYIDVTQEDSIDDSVMKGENYTIDDCILVRTTDIFPTSKTLKTPKHDNAYSFGPSSIMGDAINEEIKLRHPELSFEDLIDEAKKYNVVFETMRSTLHFALNGLVESHMYGNFDNKSVVIFEPLKYHVKDASLKSLRVEDTYFNDDIELSSEASILISEEVFNSIRSNLDMLETLKKFKVFVYRGNQKEAVKKVLTLLGYDAFILNNHGYLRGINSGTAANEMWSFVCEYAKENGIGLDRHFQSPIQIEDTKARIEKGEEIDIKHLLFVLSNTNVPKYLQQKIKEALAYGIENNRKLSYLMVELVRFVGLNRLRELTEQFNSQYIEGLKNNNINAKSSV